MAGGFVGGTLATWAMRRLLRRWLARRRARATTSTNDDDVEGDGSAPNTTPRPSVPWWRRWRRARFSAAAEIVATEDEGVPSRRATTPVPMTTAAPAITSTALNAAWDDPRPPITAAALNAAWDDPV